jgi:hypothetical protein
MWEAKAATIINDANSIKADADQTKADADELRHRHEQQLRDAQARGNAPPGRRQSRRLRAR